ncbi:50S ribosomal protein L29 [Leptolyngbya sp. PCC 6406]|uniref:50S ribosomal protein L29 n=1 Tax=Leptolyngbya sp. PCC 6406 TaxID=1173264 RepID=UPI0002ACC15C|nr:50S ribosomal protein L29 [Leptolyngbya sp. PCC 6406]
MALSKMDDIRQLSDQEVVDEIAATRRRLFDLRFQKGIRQLKTGFHQFKQERHRLAQLMTLQRQRQLATTAETNNVSTVAADTAEVQQA